MRNFYLALLCFFSFIDTSRGQVSYTPRVFAFVGDYGADNSTEDAVSKLIKSWKPESVITLGDNNYLDGNANDIDKNIGKYYHDYISPYVGSYGPGADKNRFWPSLGNHDLMTNSGAPYFDYFQLPDNERYYDFTIGEIHFFCLNGDGSEPDGNTEFSTQGNWLKNKLQTSSARWKIVYGHYPPYSSDESHGSQVFMRWPFKDWGADIVLAGHAHVYERLVVDGLTYVVNGLGGASRYNFVPVALPGSKVRYSDNYGALRLNAGSDSLTFQFFDVDYKSIDKFYLVKPPVGINEFGSDGKPVIFPNPSKGEVTINIEGSRFVNSTFDLVVKNVLGEIVYERPAIHAANDPVIEFSLSQVSAPGMFIVQLRSESATVNYKLVIRND